MKLTETLFTLSGSNFFFDPHRLSSCQVVFLLVRLPARLSSCQVILIGLVWSGEAWYLFGAVSSQIKTCPGGRWVGGGKVKLKLNSAEAVGLAQLGKKSSDDPPK